MKRTGARIAAALTRPLRRAVGRAATAADANLADLPTDDSLMAVADAVQDPATPIYNQCFLDAVDIALWELDLNPAGDTR